MTMKFATVVFGMAATLGVLVASESDGSKTTSATTSQYPLTVEETAQVKVTSTVKAINYTTREVTLADSAGHTMTMIAGPQIQRLSEVKVGDEVTAEYGVSVTATLRPATAEESMNPLAQVALGGRSPKGSEPAGVVTQGTRVVTTVAALDTANMRVTLRGPMGDMTTYQARHPENFKRLRVGDTIVITYVEGVALSLNKGGK